MKPFTVILTTFILVDAIYSLEIYDKASEPHNIVLSLKRLLVDSDNDETHKLFTSTNSMELLLNRIDAFNLTLTPPLSKNDTRKLFIRFTCEDTENDNFDWNSKEDKCKILKVEPNEYYIEGGKSSITINFQTLKQGKTHLVAHAKWLNNDKNSNKIDAIKAYVTINVGVSDTILLISAIIGWIYFVAWSVSFYPQLWYNFKRKSVVGLNFDFIGLNITGFISYSVFNFSLYAINSIRDEYHVLHPRSQIPVQLNDVFFGFHAIFATVICIIQCFIYDRGEQTVSWFGRIFLSIVWIGYTILAFVVAFTNWITILDYLYIFSYVKLVITIIKYIPQAWFNYQRKSTIGWSIGNIFLDLTGGTLSICQMFLLAYNYDDWATVFNNFTKFGLGFVSILFDILFVLQHYVFYRKYNEFHDSTSQLV